MTISTKSLLAQQFLVEEDLRLNWVFHDEEEDIMLPFLDNSSEKPYAIHLPVSDKYSQKSYIRLVVPANTSLFIKNKFIEKHKESCTRLLSVDSLLNAYKREGINLTLYNKNGFVKPADTKVGFIHKTFDSSINVNPISQRNLDNRADYLKIIILLVFTFFVILFNFFPSDLFEFLSLPSLINFRFTDTAFIKYRTLTKTQSLVIVYQAAMISGVLIVYLSYYNNPFGAVIFNNINPLLSWLAIFAIVLILIICKYILISIVSSLFHVSDKINFYFIEFLRMAMMFYSLVFVVLTFIVINQFYLVEAALQTILTTVIIFNVLRFVILYFKFRRTVPMKSLHLFSYLCTTELIPIVLGIKFFIK